VAALAGSAALFAGAMACDPPPPKVPPRASLIADPPPTETGEMPGAGQSDLDRGLAYVRNNAFADALPYLERAVKAMPSGAEACYYLALAHDRTGKRREAQAGYERALSLDPKLTNARINLGAMYLEEPPQPEKAIALLEPAAAAEPDATDIHMNLAFAYRLLKKPEKAAEHYRGALRRDDNPDARAMLVEVLSELGQKDEVVVELKKLMPAYEKDVKKMTGLGKELGKAGAFKECVEAFNKVMALDAKNANALVNRGICRHELKEGEDQVIKDYEQAVAIDPKFQAGWYYLGVSQIALRKRAKASEAFEKAYHLGPDTPIGQKAKDKWDAMIRESGGTPSRTPPKKKGG
jgi:tetratricopeptide (TPR) repeat protein